MQPRSLAPPRPAVFALVGPAPFPTPPGAAPLTFPASLAGGALYPVSGGCLLPCEGGRRKCATRPWRRWISEVGLGLCGSVRAWGFPLPVLARLGHSGPLGAASVSRCGPCSAAGSSGEREGAAAAVGLREQSGVMAAVLVIAVLIAFAPRSV